MKPQMSLRFLLFRALTPCLRQTPCGGSAGEGFGSPTSTGVEEGLEALIEQRSIWTVGPPLRENHQGLAVELLDAVPGLGPSTSCRTSSLIRTW